MLQFIVKLMRTRLLRKKKATLTKLAESIKAKHNRASVRTILYQKGLRYFRVWAHRRKKTREVQIETLVNVEVPVEVERIVEIEKEVQVIKEVPVEIRVEVPVEVDRIVQIEKEVEVIKEVPVEIRVEVPVEVDRIVEVEKEVPIFIERIKKIPEPMFIPEPQIVIHERIIPVPADITAEELERLLNAQPRLNTPARSAEKHLFSGSESEGRSTASEPTNAARSRSHESKGEEA